MDDDFDDDFDDDDDDDVDQRCPTILILITNVYI